ncbi:MAG: Undecaprenyl-diphosphatase [Syntrophaceae bacterium PtaB.Bin095]|jgi:undecaprenyl-diphosphatase|nr:MAG: Undecaprenyl-diphosphatase [Syntrophaceae bacterium PtaB.Bin095]
MDFITALILGIVQGISEFLPISSTGHLILASHLMGLQHTEFLKSFEIAIQAGTILSVVALYWRSLMVDFEVIKRLAVAFLPTGLLGLTLYRLIKGYLLGSETVVLCSLLIGGILIIAFERWYREGENATGEIRAMSYKNALIVGLFQSVAMIPGVSRSAATILGGLLLGLKRKTIVEFTFLLAVPTMLAATGYDLIKSGSQFSLDQVQYLLIGFVTAFVVALLSIKFLLRFIKTHTFIPFGIYRIVLVIVWVLLLK